MEATCIERKKVSHLDQNFNRPNVYSAEGVDHLNVSVHSKYKLGRFLDPGYCITLDYPEVGKFRSVLTLMYWLKSSDLDDRIRKLSGNKLIVYVKEKQLGNKRLPNYAAILAFATWLKVKDRPDIQELIKQLPDDIQLLSYHTNKVTGIRISTGFAPKIVPITQEIIAAVKGNREPNFSRFVTDKQHVGNHYLEPILMKHKH